MEIPELGSTEIKYISHNSATITGNIILDNDISERGVCWGTESGPTIEQNKVKANEKEDIFTSEMEDLDAETTYYVRSYATNDDGTAYGSEITVTTTSPMEDNDGNSYKTVVIGNQTWMAANLRTTRYNDGENIPNVTDDDAWSDLEAPAYSWWNNDPGNADRGGYYNYYAVNTGKLCPTGWKLPTENDWDILIDFLSEEVGEKLKHTPTGTFGNANETGFTSYMRGYRGGGNGAYGRGGNWAIYWMDGDYDLTQEWPDVLQLMSTSKGVEKDFFSPQTGASVRCIKE